MQSFYVDITKCRNAESDLASSQSNLKTASRKLDGAADGIRAMGGALASVGNSVEQLAVNASIEASEVEKLKLALHSIMNLYYAQEAGLVGQSALAGAYVGAASGAMAAEAAKKPNPFEVISDFTDKLSDAAKAYISDLIGDFIDKYTNDDGSINFNNVLVYSYTNALDLINFLFDHPAMEIFTGDDGEFVDLFVDLCNVENFSDLNLTDYEFLKEIADWDISLEEIDLDKVDFSGLKKLSKLGEVAKVLGPIGEAVNYASIAVSDFFEIFYNEETGRLEGVDNVNNWGYYITDVIIDSGVTFVSDRIGDLAGLGAGKVVTALGSVIFGTAGAAGVGTAGATGGSVAGPVGTGVGAAGGGVAGGTLGVTGSMVAGKITEYVVSGLVSMAVEEYGFNGEYFADIDGDGQKDSAVDYMKDYAHNRVDDIVEIAPSVVETTREYAENVVSDVLDAASDVRDSASEFTHDVYNTVYNTVDNLWSNTVDYAENLLELSWF